MSNNSYGGYSDGYSSYNSRQQQNNQASQKTNYGATSGTTTGSAPDYDLQGTTGAKNYGSADYSYSSYQQNSAVQEPLDYNWGLYSTVDRTGSRADDSGTSDLPAPRATTATKSVAASNFGTSSLNTSHNLGYSSNLGYSTVADTPSTTNDYFSSNNYSLQTQPTTTASTYGNTLAHDQTYPTARDSFANLNQGLGQTTATQGLGRITDRTQSSRTPSTSSNIYTLPNPSTTSASSYPAKLTNAYPNTASNAPSSNAVTSSNTGYRQQARNTTQSLTQAPTSSQHQTQNLSTGYNNGNTVQAGATQANARISPELLRKQQTPTPPAPAVRNQSGVNTRKATPSQQGQYSSQSQPTSQPSAQPTRSAQSHTQSSSHRTTQVDPPVNVLYRVGGGQTSNSNAASQSHQATSSNDLGSYESTSLPTRYTPRVLQQSQAYQRQSNAQQQQPQQPAMEQPTTINPSNVYNRYHEYEKVIAEAKAEAVRREAEEKAAAEEAARVAAEKVRKEKEAAAEAARIQKEKKEALEAALALENAKMADKAAHNAAVQQQQQQQPATPQPTAAAPKKRGRPPRKSRTDASPPAKRARTATATATSPPAQAGRSALPTQATQAAAVQVPQPTPPQPAPVTPAQPAAPSAETPETMEEEMRRMVEKLRDYQSKDPKLFLQVWSSVRKSGSGSGNNATQSSAPGAPETRSEASSTSAPQNSVVSPTSNPAQTATAARPTPAVAASADPYPDTGRRVRGPGKKTEEEKRHAARDKERRKNERRKEKRRLMREGLGPPGGATPETPVQDAAVSSSIGPERTSAQETSTPAPAETAQVQAMPPHPHAGQASNPSTTMRSQARMTHNVRETASLMVPTPQNIAASQASGSTQPAQGPAALSTTPASRPSAAASSTLSSSRTPSSIWPKEQYDLISNTASAVLNALPGNQNIRKISPGEVTGMLEKNPSYLELCIMFESLGYKFDRARFAKTLLSVIQGASAKTSGAPASRAGSTAAGTNTPASAGAQAIATPASTASSAAAAATQAPTPAPPIAIPRTTSSVNPNRQPRPRGRPRKGGQPPGSVFSTATTDTRDAVRVVTTVSTPTGTPTPKVYAWTKPHHLQNTWQVREAQKAQTQDQGQGQGHGQTITGVSQTQAQAQAQAQVQPAAQVTQKSAEDGASRQQEDGAWVPVAELNAQDDSDDDNDNGPVMNFDDDGDDNMEDTQAEESEETRKMSPLQAFVRSPETGNANYQSPYTRQSQQAGSSNALNQTQQSSQPANTFVGAPTIDGTLPSSYQDFWASSRRLTEKAKKLLKSADQTQERIERVSQQINGFRVDRQAAGPHTTQTFGYLRPETSQQSTQARLSRDQALPAQNSHLNQAVYNGQVLRPAPPGYRQSHNTWLLGQSHPAPVPQYQASAAPPPPPQPLTKEEKARVSITDLLSMATKDKAIVIYDSDSEDSDEERNVRINGSAGLGGGGNQQPPPLQRQPRFGGAALSQTAGAQAVSQAVPRFNRLQAPSQQQLGQRPPSTFVDPTAAQSPQELAPKSSETNHGPQVLRLDRSNQTITTTPQPERQEADPILDFEDIVKPFNSRDALDKTRFNPKTIAHDVLIALGLHPTQRALNAHVLPLLQNFKAVGKDSDLASFRWDIVDPGGAPVGSSTMDYYSQGAERNKRSSDGMSISVRQPVGRPGSSSAIAAANMRTVPYHPSGLRHETTHDDDTADEDGNDTVAVVIPLSTSNTGAKRRGRPPKNTSQTDPLPKRPRGRPRLNPHPEQAPTPVIRRRGRPPRGAQQSVEKVDSPKFVSFDCEWRGCAAELQNLESLRRHVYNVHGRQARKHAPIPCLWGKCGQEVVNLDSEDEAEGHQSIFADQESWKEHLEEVHMIKVAWYMGDGPQGSTLDGNESDRSSYLRDGTGHQITPFIPSPPPGPIHQHTRKPHRQPQFVEPRSKRQIILDYITGQRNFVPKPGFDPTLSEGDLERMAQRKWSDPFRRQEELYGERLHEAARLSDGLPRGQWIKVYDTQAMPEKLKEELGADEEDELL